MASKSKTGARAGTGANALWIVVVAVVMATATGWPPNALIGGLIGYLLAQMLHLRKSLHAVLDRLEELEPQSEPSRKSPAAERAVPEPRGPRQRRHPNRRGECFARTGIGLPRRSRGRCDRGTDAVAPTPQDFAYGLPLQAQPAKPLQELTVPDAGLRGGAA